jgi:hypothetical protein
MVWFFDRAAESLRLETRFDNDTREFVGVVRSPNGQGLERRFRSGEEFRNWLQAFEAALAGETVGRTPRGDHLALRMAGHACRLIGDNPAVLMAELASPGRKLSARVAL